MRILWLAPTFRGNARIRSEEIRALGADVMLVTAALRYSDFDQDLELETVLNGRPIPWADWRPCYRTYQAARRFRPDVVVTELLRDPRWRMFASLAPRIRLIHDDKPHDAKNVFPWWNRLFFNRWDARADATIVFSDYVASSLRAQGRAGSRLYVAPLHSDLDPSLIPDFAFPARERRNFVMLGRQNPKNQANPKIMRTHFLGFLVLMSRKRIVPVKTKPKMVIIVEKTGVTGSANGKINLATDSGRNWKFRNIDIRPR